MAPTPDPSGSDLDDRSPEAKAVDIASRIISAGAAVGLLGFGGHWLDQRFGWNGPMLITGVLLGSAVFLLQMLALVKATSRRPRRSNPDD
ncbi:MAG TPA: hypothetical protein DCQ98_01800 [Planctomycetaceae bacterium]|nr:hypothetical protein [Planctomycetaceae bacterium]